MRIERNALARLLAATTKVVESRNTIPILGTVKLVADGDILAITATDLDIEVSASAPCEGDIATCVDARLLDGIVKKLPASAEVEIDQDGHEISVKSGRSRFRLQTLPIADYPSFSDVNYDAEFEIDLAALVAPVQFAISTEETRFYLNGVYLHNKGGRLVAVATDGHRMARNSVDPNEAGAFDGLLSGVIIPRKLVGLLPKGRIHVSLSDGKIKFTAPEVTFTSKLIDGTFPDYERIIPSGNDKLITFESPAMKQAAERVSVVSSERGRAVKLSFADGQATLAVRAADTGSADEDISVVYDGEPIEIGFNSAYVAEIIGNFPSGEIELALADAGSPALFTSKAAPDLLAILMPMRV